MTQASLSAFFGWMTVLNFCLLAFATIALFVARNRIEGIHSRMFDLPPDHVRATYFRYLANYKLLTLVFGLVPWLALRLI